MDQCPDAWTNVLSDEHADASCVFQCGLRIPADPTRRSQQTSTAKSAWLSTRVPRPRLVHPDSQERQRGFQLINFMRRRPAILIEPLSQDVLCCAESRRHSCMRCLRHNLRRLIYIYIYVCIYMHIYIYIYCQSPLSVSAH